MDCKWKNVFETKWASASILALGLALGGCFIYAGIHELSVMNRGVTVKGLSEKDVTSDYVVWPMSFQLNGNDLPELYGILNILGDSLQDFFVQKGFAPEEVTIGNTHVDDNWSNYYSERRPTYRYTLHSSIIISTSEIQKVIDNQSCPSELLSKGLILNSYEWSADYSYKGLSTLKPEMIEEATKNARAVAQKFAEDSHSRLGNIRHASQGQFSIESDENRPWIKHVRVVTTVEYSLK